MEKKDDQFQYTNNDLFKHILPYQRECNTYDSNYIPQRRLSYSRINGSLKYAKKVKDIRVLYLYYCYKLGVLPEGNPNKPIIHYLERKSGIWMK